MDIYLYDLRVDNLKVISFFNGFKLICLLASNAIVSIQLNGFNYCYQTLIILFNINHLFAHREVVISIAVNTSYSIQN